MTDAHSGFHEPETANDDRQDRLLKSLIAVCKENRDALSSLPEMMERFLDKKPVNPSLTETGLEEELCREDDLERLAYKKRRDMEKKLESLEDEIELKTKRITALDQTIKEKTATIEALKSEENTIMFTKDRKSSERELKKKDKQLEANDKQVKALEEENLKLKSELKKERRDISKTIKVHEEKILAVKNESEKSVKPETPDKAQLMEEKKSTESELKEKDKQLEASEKRVKALEEEHLKLQSELKKERNDIAETLKLQEEKILTVKNESEKSVKEMSDKAQHMEEELRKKEGDFQQMYDDYSKALKKQKSSYDSMIEKLADRDKKIEAYIQSLSKMKEELKNAHMKMDLYKSRLASLSEKRVKQDQRLVEDTLGSNRQSELERDFSAFFDEDRVDACEKMQSIYLNKEEDYLYIYYPRLACIIFETAYEHVKEAKEAASDLFKELIKNMIDLAPHMGQTFSITRKMGQLSTCIVPINVNTWGDGSEYSKDVMDGMMLSLKEAAHTCNLDCLVNSVLTIAFEQWRNWYDEDKSCMFTPAQHLIQDLDKFAKACLRLTWRMVTQVPPMKLEFHSSKFNQGIHKNMGYHSSFKRSTRNTQPAQEDQYEEIVYYLWPGLQDGGGRLIRAGEVICKFEER